MCFKDVKMLLILFLNEMVLTTDENNSPMKTQRIQSAKSRGKQRDYCSSNIIVAY